MTINPITKKPHQAHSQYTQVHFQWTLYRTKPCGETTIALECDSFRELSQAQAKLEKAFPTHQFTYRYNGKYISAENE